MAKWIFGFIFVLSLTPTVQAVGVNDPAPEFRLPRLGENAETAQLSDYRGKVVLVNFWASWCKPCKEELPALDALYRQYQKAGFEIMGVNIDKNLKHARHFLSKHPVSFSIFTDPEASVIASFHARGMPSSFLIDQKGMIRWVKFGFSGSQIGQFEDQIKKLLEASSHVQDE